MKRLTTFVLCAAMLIPGSRVYASGFFGGGSGGASVTVTETDGAPYVSVGTIKFTNGTVTDDGSGVASVTISGTGSPTDATYITQTANGTLSNEQALGSLSTGCMASTATTGVVATRTITGTSNEITVTNGDCSGAPTISLPATIDLGGKTSFEVPNAAAPTTDAFGEIAGDNNAWAASRGTLQIFDGTANTWAVNVLASDTPGNGECPKWNTGGTITWESCSGGSGTVTVVSSGSLTSTALVTGGGTTTLQTPAATATMDSSGNISTPGTISTGVGSGVAGGIEMTQGTAPTAGTTSVKLYAPASVTSYILKLPAASATGLILGTDAAGVNTMSFSAVGTGVLSSLAIANNSAGGYSPIDGAAVLTNKTLDAEGTGNLLTIPRRLWFPAAGVSAGTAASIWDLPTTNPAVAGALVGTNTVKGVLDFADGANTLSAQIIYKLPSTWTGTVDATIKWLSATTTNDVVWQLATICVADAETDDPAFNTASTVTDTAKGTTNQTNDATITGVTVTGCAAGELMHLKILRDPTHASDTHAATARLIGVELVIREAI